MIRINLATKKKAGNLESSGSGSLMDSLKGIVGGGGGAGAPLTLQGFPLRKVLTAGILVLIISYASDQYKADEVSKLKVRLNAKQARLNEMRKQESSLRAVLSVKGQLKKDELLLTSKIETIRALIAGRELPPRILRFISASMPENIWSESIQIGREDFSMNGASLGFDLISEFMTTLEGGEFFQGMELVNAVTQRFNGLDVRRFSLKGKVR